MITQLYLQLKPSYSSITNSTTDSLHKYNVHRSDRNIKLGGGVLCLVSKNWPSFLTPIPERF